MLGNDGFGALQPLLRPMLMNINIRAGEVRRGLRQEKLEEVEENFKAGGAVKSSQVSVDVEAPGRLVQHLCFSLLL